VIEYSIAPLVTTITFAVHRDVNYVRKESELKTVKEEAEKTIIATVKNDAAVQEGVLTQTNTVRNLPKTSVEVMVC